MDIINTIGEETAVARITMQRAVVKLRNKLIDYKSIFH